MTVNNALKNYNKTKPCPFKFDNYGKKVCN